MKKKSDKFMMEACLLSLGFAVGIAVGMAVNLGKLLFGFEY